MSKDVVSRTLSVHQEHELLMKLEDAGLSKEEAQLIIDSKDNELARKIVDLVRTRPAYNIVVDYNRSLADMIKAGKYDRVDSGINTEHFPLKGKGKHELTAILFLFDRYIESDDAIVEMDKQGYRPATIEELLALGEKYPKLPKEFPIIALGSVWRNPDGDRSVPYLYWLILERNLNLGWFDDRWNASCRFLALRK